MRTGCWRLTDRHTAKTTRTDIHSKRDGNPLILTCADERDFLHSNFNRSRGMFNNVTTRRAGVSAGCNYYGRRGRLAVTLPWTWPYTWYLVLTHRQCCTNMDTCSSIYGEYYVIVIIAPLLRDQPNEYYLRIPVPIHYARYYENLIPINNL